MKKIIIILIGLVAFMQGAFAEKGTIRGKIVDGENGEELIGVNVVIEGTTIGGSTDIDGGFAFQVEEGRYSILISYISYTSKTIEDIEVIGGKVTALDIIHLAPESFGLDEVVVVARALTNTDNALLSIQHKSANVIDGISAQTFSKTGDGDAAAAMKRVTGVTVEGGKYVYVRGLGDRYSKSILNGLEIPGLDPERNSVQMDIFPTNVIDNIIVYKSFTPELPGDFTGGMIDVTTKQFPNQFTVSVSASLGYNSVAHFKDDFILYQGSKFDALALGAKDRALPFNLNYEPDRNNPALLFANTDALNKEIEPMNTGNFLDQSYAFSIGNQINKERVTLGYLVSMNYRNNFNFQPDFLQTELQIVDNQHSEGAGYLPDIQIIREGKVGFQESLWSTLLSGSAKWKKSKLGFNYLHTQSGEKSAAQRDIDDRFDNLPSIENSLDYIQRSVSNIIVNGEHHIKGDKLSLTWANALTKNLMNNPDQTNSEVINRNGKLLFNPGSTRLLKVTRSLDEWNNNFKTDLQFKFRQWNGLDAKFKAGTSLVYKNRAFNTSVVSIGPSNDFSQELIVLSDGINAILETENLFSPENDLGYFIDGVQIDKENQYNASMYVFGNYVMTELPLHDRIKFIGGLRTEWAIMQYNGNERLTGLEIKGQVLNSFKLLPATNFIFSLSDDINLRTNYSKTLARPTFREKSESIIYDPISSNTFYGNIDLIETDVHNVDTRLEYFFGRGQIVAFSAFYKKFINPIEIQPLENSGPTNIQPINRPNADLIGIEFEIRKNFSFITEKLANLTLATNFTYVKSYIDLSNEQKDKYVLLNQRIPNKREMLGQSPYVVNVGLSYSKPEIGTEVNLSYNVKGRTLILAGIGTIPDIYEDPFHGLDFKISQEFGTLKQYKLSASIQNIIGDNMEQYYDYLGENVANFTSYSRGRQYTLGFTYNIK